MSHSVNSVVGMKPNASLLLGLVVCVVAAILMLADVVASGWGVAIGMLGIGITSTSAVARRDQPTDR
jgi:fucose permease